MDKTVIVIPCYNEAERLREDEFNLLLQHPSIELIFVNDGSTDQTELVLRSFISRIARGVYLLNLKNNAGKAESVRQGLLHAMNNGALIVGFIDADMSTPAREVLRLLEDVHRNEYAVVMGSRVKLLGTSISRRKVRHYVGRIFATLASIILRLPVYDTQCGAKFFHVSALLKEVLAEPFSSRWVFDVELIGRLLIGSKTSTPLTISDFVEVPLKEWTDIRGSKISPLDVIKVPTDMIRVAYRLRKRRISMFAKDGVRG